LPNYLGATAGTTAGITDDGAPEAHPVTNDNLFRQVRNAGGTSRSYEEAMATPCALESAGRYAVKHNPAAYFVGADDRAACSQDNVPMGEVSGGALVDDLTHDTLPTFGFVTPDLCHDTHDCPVSDGDRWLASVLGAAVASPAYERGDLLVLVVWDEPTPMPFIAIGRGVRAGVRIDGPIDHYSLLRTTEELLGLPLLGNATTAVSMRAALGV
jgi:hypothetical protein